MDKRSTTNKNCFPTQTVVLCGTKTPATSTFAIGWVSCSKDSFMVNQTLVFQMKFCGENRHIRQARNGWVKFYNTLEP